MYIHSREVNRDEEYLLKRGAGYAIVPEELPIDEFIVFTEKAARNIAPGATIAMLAEVIEVLKEAKKPISNLSKEERKAMKDLKKDETIIIVPADKGRCLVIMDRSEYIEKMENKLKD